MYGIDDLVVKSPLVESLSSGVEIRHPLDVVIPLMDTVAVFMVPE